MITKKELDKLFEYNYETGLFKWKVARSNRIKVGQVVGTKGTGGYLTVYLNKRHYRLHRLAWLMHYGEWPKYQIDHINHIPTDNRIINLRDVPNVANSRNASLGRNSSTGINGVCYEKTFDRYKVYIKVNGKNIVLGRRKTLEEAETLRKEADIKYGFHKNHGTKRKEII